MIAGGNGPQVVINEQCQLQILCIEKGFSIFINEIAEFLSSFTKPISFMCVFGSKNTFVPLLEVLLIWVDLVKYF